MDRTADKFTPLWMPWRETLKRAGSFDALQPYLHLGRIPVRHGGLYSWPDGQPRSGPGDVKPEWWAHAYVQAGRVIFITESVVSGYAVIQEQVFAYAISVELDSVAFETFFPVAAVSTIVDTAGASVQWAIAATRNLQAENKIPEGITKAKLARVLAAEAQKAAKAGQLSRTLKASYIENQLIPWGIWPLK